MTASNSDTGLPASVETAWGLRSRPTKGPRPGIGVERIVEAAIKVAGSEGLGAVSMGRVAKELGASTMSLYRYVSAKDELFILMTEAGTGAPPRRPDAASGWRDGLAWWALAQRDVYRGHLWLLRVPITSPPATPNSVAWMEAGLATLQETALDEGSKLAALQIVNGYVRNEALLMADLDAAMTRSGLSSEETMRRYVSTLTRLTRLPGREGEFPAVTRLLESGVLDGAGTTGTEDDFVYGLERILDGIDAMVRSAG